ERVLAGVAQRLGDEEQDGAKRDQGAECVERAVHPVERGEAGEAEERCRTAPVAGQSESVLRSGEPAVGGIELARRLGALGRPIRDTERDQKNDRENRERRAHDDAPARAAAASPASLSKVRLATRT